MISRMLKMIGTVLAVPVLLFLTAVYHYFPGYNFRVVEKGVFYGSRQMSGPALERTIQKWGIKTVINLRGENPDAPWYQEEVETCRRMGVQHVDFGWSRNSIPAPESLAAYIDTVKNAPKPILVHCEGGTHRTGVAAAIWLLLRGNDTHTARGQFGLMFRNAPIGEVVSLYEQYSAGMAFEEWVKARYPDIYKQYTGISEESNRTPVLFLDVAKTADMVSPMVAGC